MRRRVACSAERHGLPLRMICNIPVIANQLHRAPPMYVCLCHGFTDRDLRRASSEAGGTVSDTYRALNARPTCGKCVPMVRDAVRTTQRRLTERAAAS